MKTLETILVVIFWGLSAAALLLIPELVRMGSMNVDPYLRVKKERSSR